MNTFSMMYVSIYDILTEEQIRSLLTDIGKKDYIINDKFDKIINERSFRLFNSSIAKLNDDEYLYSFRYGIGTRFPFTPGYYEKCHDKISSGVPGNNFWWRDRFNGGVNGTVYFKGDHRIGKMTLLSPVDNRVDTSDDDIRLWSVNNEVYSFNATGLRLDKLFVKDKVIESASVQDSLAFTNLRPTGNLFGRNFIPILINDDETIIFDVIDTTGVRVLHRFSDRKIKQRIGRYEIDFMKPIYVQLNVIKETEDMIMEKVNNNELTEEDEQKYTKIIEDNQVQEATLNKAVENHKQILASIKGTLGELDYPIKYSGDNILSVSGSCLSSNSNKEDIQKYKRNYGKTPGFSFTTPHVSINHNLHGRCFLGLGHTKIRSPDMIFKYVEGSPINTFRQNLYRDMKKYYPDRYASHIYGGHEGKECHIGYIYLMYFYLIKEDLSDMYVSDSYLPFDLSDTKNGDIDYKFSLVFPVGLLLEDEKLTVSAGEGDFYTIFMTFALNEVLTKCTHSIKDLDMDTYRFRFIVQGKSGKVYDVDNLEEAIANESINIQSGGAKNKHFRGLYHDTKKAYCNMNKL